MTRAAQIASALLVLILFCAVASAQEMEPRAYSRAPVGTQSCCSPIRIKVVMSLPTPHYR
jgi:hypothetical protein